MALVFLTGPVRSGKSDLSVALAADRVASGSVLGVTIAVFTDPTSDPEFTRRVEAHRATRPADWEVLECHDHPMRVAEVPDDRLLLVDCLGTAVGALMGVVTGDGQETGPAQAQNATDLFVSALLQRAGDTIVVSNEVGWGVVPSTPAGRLFRDLVGRANRDLAAQAESAFLVVSGRALDLTVMPQRVVWPED